MAYSITVLTTLAESAASDDPAICNQIPKSLKTSRTLVLCPPALVDNWYDEFLAWTPSGSTSRLVGNIHRFKYVTTLPQRLDVISIWREEGGIFILSYDMFRNFILNNDKKDGTKALGEEDHSFIRKALLQGPNVIVADEAHKLKNAKSGINLASSQFKSKSRIALTGSPLANNLNEYYEMINWIAPQYLGTPSEFKDRYSEPINEGLYADSSPWERRKSRMRLKLLSDDLAPKIHRADITVLKGDLPSKTEFLITVPLTDLQKQCYEMYVDSVLRKTGQDGKVSESTLWGWLAILGLVCNHPAAFKKKLEEREAKFREAVASLDTTDAVGRPLDVSLASVGLPSAMIESQKGLLENASESTPISATDLSNKMKIFDAILAQSMAVGDKLLVFTLMIPMLDYLEEHLQATKVRYMRLDGKQAVSGRQEKVKMFNEGDYNIYLISTRAGGLGLNIQGANRVIIFDFGFNPQWEEQAVGRAYRMGQKKAVFVYRFVAGGTYEKIVLDKAVFKTQLASRVVDKKNPIRHTARDARDYLFHPKVLEQEDLSEYLGKDPKVLDSILENETFSGCITSLKLTETFQQEDTENMTADEIKETNRMMALKRKDPEEFARQLSLVEKQQSTPINNPTQQIQDAATMLATAQRRNWLGNMPAQASTSFGSPIPGPGFSGQYQSPFQASNSGWGGHGSSSMRPIRVADLTHDSNIRSKNGEDGSHGGPLKPVVAGSTRFEKTPPPDANTRPVAAVTEDNGIAARRSQTPQVQAHLDVPGEGLEIPVPTVEKPPKASESENAMSVKDPARKPSQAPGTPIVR